VREARRFGGLEGVLNRGRSGPHVGWLSADQAVQADDSYNILAINEGILTARWLLARSSVNEPITLNPGAKRGLNTSAEPEKRTSKPSRDTEVTRNASAESCALTAAMQRSSDRSAA